MRKVRENILVTSGNYPLFTEGANVFLTPDPLYGGPTLAPAPGQAVAFDPQFGVGLDATTASGRDSLVFGVVEDFDGDGMGDSLRKTFGDKLFGSYVDAFTAEPPRCGTSEIIDVLFNCPHCDNPYTLHMTIEDSETQTLFPWNKQETWTYTSNVSCCSCDDCPDDSANGCLIVNDLVSQINGVLKSDYTKRATFGTPPAKAPVTAVRLFSGANASKWWCFDPIAASNCSNCIAVDKIKSFEYDLNDGVGGISNPQTLVFTNNVNPANSAETLIGQLKEIARQINVALNGRGFAVVTGGVGPCCPVRLEVNTCATGVALLDNTDADITACGVANPMAPVTSAEQCLNCGEATTPSTTYDFGLRIIVDSVVLPPLHGYPPNPPKNILFRKAEIYPSGGFSCGSVYVRKTQKADIPENLGYQWMWRDFASQAGGSGREHQGFIKNYGPLNLPGAETRANSARVNPYVSYCSYILEHGLPHTGVGVSDPFRIARGRTVILVPSGDSTTRTSIEAFFNGYLASVNNRVRTTVTCASEQDQTETSGTSPNLTEGYPDSNGMIY
jgi:hypothetical protein